MSLIEASVGAAAALAVVDCPTGLAGNMLLGALFDLGLPEAVVAEPLAALGLAGAYRIELEERRSGGLRGLHLAVQSLEPEPDHRHWGGLQRQIAEAPLEPELKRQVLAVFGLLAEAEAVVHRMRMLEAAHPELTWGQMAVLYRTNAQSRAMEESLVRWGIPYIVVGGLRFYDRREIKDVLAYLRLLINPADSVSLLRVLNVPKRGIGKTTIERLSDAANQLGIPLWEVVSDPEAVRSLGGRSAKGLLQFCELINGLQARAAEAAPSELVQLVIERSGYLAELIAAGTDEAEDRRRNLNELVNAALQYQEENEEGSLDDFLASAALASDADSKDTEQNRVTLMTLHASKGLEFPVVFLVGLEQGLFPSYRSLDDPASLEEERRLCYVAMTRARKRLLLPLRLRQPFGSFRR